MVNIIIVNVFFSALLGDNVRESVLEIEKYYINIVIVLIIIRE